MIQSSQHESFLAEHRFLIAEVARMANLDDPVAVEPDDFLKPLLDNALRGPFLPVEGVLVRDWSPDGRRSALGATLGARQYSIDGIVFARVSYRSNYDQASAPIEFLVVGKKNYARLYRSAVRCRSRVSDEVPPPVLADGLREALWKNSINYLEEANLRKIRAYGGRAKRGLLLTGPPGNGKTSACRWLWFECRKRNWEWRLVTPDAYASARRQCNPEAAVRALFAVENRGIIFFDDMDLALRDRDKSHETDDQSVFLNALDGISGNEGVAFVFTTNCPLDLIDPAFKRPGRIDLVIRFEPPDADMRRRLIGRWHADIRAALDVESVVAGTDGFSFAELDEVKNLMIVQFMDTQCWDWDDARECFAANRHDFAASRRNMGFSLSHTAEDDD